MIPSKFGDFGKEQESKSECSKSYMFFLIYFFLQPTGICSFKGFDNNYILFRLFFQNQLLDNRLYRRNIGDNGLPKLIGTNLIIAMH